MNRRKFFGASTGAVVAGPSVVASAKDAVAALGANQANSYFYGPAVGKAISTREYLTDDLDRQRARLHELETGGLDAVQASSRLMGYDAYGNIEALRSVSPVSKALMRTRVNSEREYRDQLKGIREAIEHTLKKLAGLA